MDSEPIQAGVIRMAVIRFYSQLHNLVFAIHARGLHLKVLIAGRIVRIGVLIVAEVGRLLVILVGQALERGLNQFRIGRVYFSQSTHPDGESLGSRIDSVIGQGLGDVLHGEAGHKYFHV